MRSFRRHDTLSLLWPTLFDNVAGIVTQLILQSATDRLRIAAEITIQGLKARGFFGNDVAHGGIILISGNRQQPEQQTIEHGKTGEDKTHHVVGAPLGVNPAVVVMTK